MSIDGDGFEEVLYCVWDRDDPTRMVTRQAIGAETAARTYGAHLLAKRLTEIADRCQVPSSKGSVVVVAAKVDGSHVGVYTVTVELESDPVGG